MSPGERAARRIRAIRQRRGLSAKQLAERMTAQGEPVSDVRIRHIETGRTALRIDDVWRFAAALDVSPWLLLATHPTDDDLDIGGMTVAVLDAVAFEAGADTADGRNPQAAQQASDAFGDELLPAHKPTFEELVEVRAVRAAARHLGDDAKAAIGREADQRLEAAAEQWQNTATSWRAWLAQDPRGLGEKVADHIDGLPPLERKKVLADAEKVGAGDRRRHR